MLQRLKRGIAVVCAAVSVAGALPVASLAQSAMGRVTGFVYDSQSGDVLRRAGVEVAGGGKTVFTGVDGDYSLDVPAGTYTLRIFFDKFTDQTTEVVVTAGKTTEQNVVLVP